MEGKDEIQELFSQKLGNYEAKVDPSLWNGVASQLGNTAATVASSGMSMLTKVIIGASLSVAVITTTFLLIPSDTEPSAEQSSIALSNKESKEVEQTTSSKDQTATITAEVITEVEVPITSEDEVMEDQIDSPERIDENFEMPITEFGEGLIDEDCVGCDLVERTEDTSDDIDNPNDNGDNSEEVLPETKVEREKAKEEKVPEIHVPKPVYFIEQYTNVFSPNGDGTNDVFSLKIQGLTDFKISILDFNDGKTLFETRDINFTWGGLDKSGSEVKQGDYIFIITALDFDENPIREIKSLTIAR